MWEGGWSRESQWQCILWRDRKWAVPKGEESSYAILGNGVGRANGSEYYEERGEWGDTKGMSHHVPY